VVMGGDMVITRPNLPAAMCGKQAWIVRPRGKVERKTKGGRQAHTEERPLCPQK